MKNITKAVIPAAGFGTRFLPATKAQPKEMLPIVDKPTIQYVVEEAAASGISEVLIVTGKEKRSIQEHFGKSQALEEHLKKHNKAALLEMVEKISHIANISYIIQHEPLGLGDAVLHAEKFCGGESFALLLGDTIVTSKSPCTSQLIEKMEKYKGSMIAVEEVPKNRVQNYGIVRGKEVSKGIMQVSELVEKPTPEKAPSNLGIIGRYVLENSIFEQLHQTGQGKNGEVQLTDALNSQARKKPMYACNFEGTRYDIGDRLDYAKAFAKFSMDRQDIGAEFKEYLKKLVG